MTLELFNSEIESLMAWMKDSGYPHGLDISTIDNFETEYKDRMMKVEQKLFSALKDKYMTDEEFRDRCAVLDDVNDTVTRFIKNKRSEQQQAPYGSNVILGMSPTRKNLPSLLGPSPDDIEKTLPPWMTPEQKQSILAAIRTMMQGGHKGFGFFVIGDDKN